jgi:dTDP-4-amino-4,6-dideoxygalactose transaminase
MLRDHGQSKKYFHEVLGYNGRLDAIQAGILRVKLKHLAQWNEKRRQNAYEYNKLLGGLDGVITPHEPPWAKAVYHLYVIRIQARDELWEYLSGNGIATGFHYPLPLHLQEACSNLGHDKGAFPVSEKVASEIISLPMYPELTYHHRNQVASKIREFLS